MNGIKLIYSKDIKGLEIKVCEFEIALHKDYGEIISTSLVHDGVRFVMSIVYNR